MNWEDMPRLDDLTWRQKKPTRPGFYLWRFDSESQTEIVELKPSDTTDPAYWQVLTSRGCQLLGFMAGEWSDLMRMPA